jgi:hypothetical protein
MLVTGRGDRGGEIQQPLALRWLPLFLSLLDVVQGRVYALQAGAALGASQNNDHRINPGLGVAPHLPAVGHL